MTKVLRVEIEIPTEWEGEDDAFIERQIEKLIENSSDVTAVAYVINEDEN